MLISIRRTMKNGFCKALSNEAGAVLVLALMTTTLLAVFSLTAIMTATQGLHMGAQYRAYQDSVYVADGGTDYAPGLIERTLVQINGNAVPFSDQLSNANLVFCAVSSGTWACDPPTTAGNGWNYFQQKVTGQVVTYNTANPDKAASTPNLVLTYPVTGEKVNIVVEYLGSKVQPGSSTETAARYEGIGAGTSGGVGILYRVDSFNNSSKPNIVENTTVRSTFQCIEGGGRCL